MAARTGYEAVWAAFWAACGACGLLIAVGWWAWTTCSPEPWEREPRTECERAVYTAAYEAARPKRPEPEQTRTLWACGDYVEWTDAVDRYPESFAGTAGDRDAVPALPGVARLCREGAAASPVCRDLHEMGIVTYQD